ncbi:TPA: hypothetical protein ACRR3T_004682 [Enterobacter asburiae]
MQLQRVTWNNAGTVDIAPPRSLGRYALAVRLRRALRVYSYGDEQELL